MLRPSTREQNRQKVETISENESTDFITTEFDDCEDVLYEDLTAAGHENEVEEKNENEGMQIVFVSEEELDSSKINTTKEQSPFKQELSREDKFIQAVYPQFRGKTKLQLIEEILDLKRRNDLLEVKAKTYENTINRLLN